MRSIREIFAAASIPFSGKEMDVTALEYDSRNCRSGSVFFAFPGIHSNGSDHIADAIEHGAVAVVAETQVACPVPLYVTKNVHHAFALMCAAFHDYPARRLTIIGVTGTDGKSTTCEYLHQLLLEQGIHSGLIGTVSLDNGNGKGPSPYRQSTPEAGELQGFLHDCVENGLSVVILECTSHALSPAYDRLAGITYDIAIVTTVTSEHLEFHKTLASYVDAKCNLVRRVKDGGTFIGTRDNPHLDEFLEKANPKARHIIIGDDLTVEKKEASFLWKGTEYPVSVGEPVLVGNAILAAVAASVLTKTTLSSNFIRLSHLGPVDGRMVRIPNDRGLILLIDFAHTADAYAKLFPFIAGKKGSGRLLALFGCAGERDTSKREPMGKIASHYADALFLTDEDPRQEGIVAIDRDILRSAEKKPFFEIEDRRKAIRAMLAYAKKGDTLLFLGKGHEHSIEKNGKKYPWNEREEVVSALKESLS